MDLSGYSVAEIVNIYGQAIKELKKRGVLRTNNVVGELGEYFVLEQYNANPELPTLSVVPLGTKNINAISQDGERYTIKSTSGNVTGVIYGLEPLGSTKADVPVFEYMIICKLTEDYELNSIYQLSWDAFQKHKKWHSRMKAWNITLSKAVIDDATIVYSPKEVVGLSNVSQNATADINSSLTVIEPITTDTDVIIKWNKTAAVNHADVRRDVAERLQKYLSCNLKKTSQSRYVSTDKEVALFVTSASYSQKNGEYWYSINDDNIPWLELFPKCHVAFALGDANHVLLFPYATLSKMFEGCLKTKEDPQIKKKSHYHISFAVEGSRVYFKKKLPEKEFVDVSDYLI